MQVRVCCEVRKEIVYYFKLGQNKEALEMTKNQFVPMFCLFFKAQEAPPSQLLHSLNLNSDLNH